MPRRRVIFVPLDDTTVVVVVPPPPPTPQVSGLG
jgi:hypothetical protein